MCIISQSESTKSSHSFEEPFLPNTFWYNLLRVVAMPSFECAVSVAMSLGLLSEMVDGKKTQMQSTCITNWKRLVFKQL